MKLTSYKDYVPSRTPIINFLPANWEVSKISRIAKRGYRTFVDGDWIESPYITSEGIRLIQTGNVGVGTYKEQGFRYISEGTFRLLNCTAVEPGDVLICRLADPVGRACLAPNLGIKMITSVDVCILKASRDWDSRYITYFLSSKPYLDFIDSVSRGGTRDRISRSFLGNVRIPKPHLREQQQIGNFLDRETAEADALIAKYERLLELLEEKRIALITQAVTKGLDPRVPMKQSGVEWIGQIPEHWSVFQLKHLVSLITKGTTPTTFGKDFVADGVRFIKVEAISNYQTIIEDKCAAIDTETDYLLGRSRLQEGDVLVSIAGAIGRVAVVRSKDVPANTNQAVAICRPKCKIIESAWLSYAISSDPSQRVLNDASVESAQANLSLTMLGRLPIAFPSLNEQRLILDTLRKQLEKVDNSKRLVMRATNLVRERRAALITAAVTGQIDVTTYKSGTTTEVA